MANGTKEDVERIDEDDPRYLWPTTSQAVNKLGVHKRTLENMVRRGEIRYVYDTKGDRHFNPEDLSVAADKPVTDKVVEAEVETSTIGALESLVKTLLKANEGLLKLATDPAKAFTDIIVNALEKQQLAYERLQAKYIAGIEAFEAALNNQAERELEKQKQTSQDERMNKALDKGLEQLPAIVAGLANRKAVSGFLNTLTDEQKGYLFDMLTPAQLELLGKLHSKFTKSNGASGESSSGGNTEQEGEKPS